MVSYKTDTAAFKRMQDEQQKARTSTYQTVWKTKESGWAMPESEKRIRGNSIAKEAWKNRLLKSSYRSAGAAVAQAARMGRNALRRGN